MGTRTISQGRKYPASEMGEVKPLIRRNLPTDFHSRWAKW
jgi:hypothetical protein